MEQKLGRKLEFNEIVHHKNENKKDNSENNLEIESRSEHSRKHMKGRKLSEETKEKLRIANKAKGTEKKNAKLTEEKVVDIKKRLNNGEGVRALAREYEVNHTTISDIKLGRAWKHVS